MINAEFNQLICDRTKAFAIRSMKFVENLPFNTVTKVMGEQYLKASSSVGANFRAFCRGRSRNEKFSKICIVVEESDESVYWLDMFAASKFGDKAEVNDLYKEAMGILLICSSIKNGMFPQ